MGQPTQFEFTPKSEYRSSQTKHARRETVRRFVVERLEDRRLLAADNIVTAFSTAEQWQQVWQPVSRADAQAKIPS